MPLEGFEPTFPASDRPHNHAVDSKATRIGSSYGILGLRNDMLLVGRKCAKLFGTHRLITIQYSQKVHQWNSF
jgi:hypothetical protein